MGWRWDVLVVVRVTHNPIQHNTTQHITHTPKKTNQHPQDLPDVLSKGFRHRFQQWLLTSAPSASSSSSTPAPHDRADDARRLVAAAQRTFGRVFRRKLLTPSAAPSASSSSSSAAQPPPAACLRTDEDVRGFMARQAGAFGYELSFSSISSVQRRGPKGARLQTAQRAWNLLIDFLTSSAPGAGGVRAVGATSAEALGKLKVKVKGEGEGRGRKKVEVGVQEEEEDEDEEEDEEEEGTVASGGTSGGGGAASKRRPAIGPELRRSFAGWMEAHRRVSGVTAAGYATSVDQIMVGDEVVGVFCVFLCVGLGGGEVEWNA